MARFGCGAIHQTDAVRPGRDARAEDIIAGQRLVDNRTCRRVPVVEARVIVDHRTGMS